MVIPVQFTATGVLNPGDHKATLAEIRTSILVSGAGVLSPHWDVTWRATCVDNLEIMVKQLWKIGIDKIFIDGSFVEEKDHPNDIDGYFDCDFMEFVSGKIETELNLLDPHKIWTWTHNREDLFVVTQRPSYQCGISIELSCGQIMASPLELKIVREIV